MQHELVSKALAFAHEQHTGQYYGSVAYMVHVEQVVNIVRKYFPSNAIMLAAAYLHDVMEDCGVAREEMEKLFGFDVTNLVWRVTGEGGNRKERNESIYLKVQDSDAARAIKIADRIANVRHSYFNRDFDKLFMYYKEMPTFFKKLYKHTDSREIQEMWEELCNELGGTLEKWIED